ncbi:MAG TPA: histidine kinase [Casimicrobiaceae bacterium]
MPIAERISIARAPLERWFAGLTWKGVALIVLLCVVNGVRRMSPDLSGDMALSTWLMRMAETTAYGLIVAVPVVLSVVAAYNLAPRRGPLRYAVVALAVALSSAAGVAAMVAVEAVRCGDTFAACFNSTPAGAFIGVWLRSGVLCGLFAVVFVYLRTADESAVRAQEADRERASFAQRMDEARLTMLQAQIEPHFLFNTLANVRRLYRTAPGHAVTMLDNLMRYFAVALPQMRASASTLGREAELAASYLGIEQIRMGRRLAVDIDVPGPLRGASFPPMMLLTLAENAIKHGLAPLPEGGVVRISATVRGDALQVCVADSGRGFTRTSGGGTGLANIRARLTGMYGAGGRLTLSANAPRGVVATIAVPLSMAPATPTAP